MRSMIKQFIAGMIDAMRIPDALITICMDGQLRWLNLKCFVLNGLLFLGAVLVYSLISNMLSGFSGGGASSGEMTLNEENAS